MTRERRTRERRGGGPPRFGQWLLGVLLPPEVRDALLGDAAEGWAAREREAGRLRAWLWYCGEVVASRWLSLRLEARRARRVERVDSGRRRSMSTWLDAAWRDVRQGLRGLRRSPGFALAAVLTLGLGTGAATAVFSLVNGVLLRPLAFREPDRLVMLFDSNAERGLVKEPLSPVNFMDDRAAERVFEDAAAWWRPENNLSDDIGDPIRVTSIEVSENLFDVLGVQPIIGRGFPRDSTLWGNEAEVVISRRLWRTRFASDPSVVGSTVRLNGRPFEVVGVMPAGFNYPDGTDVWQRLSWDLTQHSRGAHFMGGVARVRRGIPLERVNAELESVAVRLERDYPSTNQGWRVHAVPVDLEIAGVFRPALLSLLAAAGLLLLIACINVANLLLARATGRTVEVALRAVLGASRVRLLSQLLTESLLIALAGGLLGFVTAVATLRAFLAWSPIAIPRADDVGVSGAVLGFALLCALGTALVFGLAPALLLSRTKLSAALREQARGSSASGAGQRTRGMLVAMQVALAVMLLAGAGLLIRSVGGMLRVDSGVRAMRVVTGDLELAVGQYPDWNGVAQFYSRLADDLRLQPGVVEVGSSNFLPLEAGWRIPFLIPGQPTETGNAPSAQLHSADEGWTGVLGIPLRAGRTFAETDDANAPAVVVVNEALVKRYWPNEDVIGRTITIPGRGIGPLGLRLVDGNETNNTVEIIGVVGDVRNATSTSRGIAAGAGTALQTDAEPAIYYNQKQYPFRNMHVYVRGSGDAGQLTATLRDAVRRLDPTLPLANIQTMEQVLAAPADPPRLVMSILIAFALLALTLAAIGIYGVLSYAVNARRREIGIRMALGARPSEVVVMVMRQGVWLGLAGGLAGLAGAVLAGRFLSSLLFGIAPTDPLTLAGVFAVAAIVAVLACLIPGRRAAALQPASTLRSD
jgi:putative ABC transport system permease protein